MRATTEWRESSSAYNHALPVIATQIGRNLVPAARAAGKEHSYSRRARIFFSAAGPRGPDVRLTEPSRSAIELQHSDARHIAIAPHSVQCPIVWSRAREPCNRARDCTAPPHTRPSCRTRLVSPCQATGRAVVRPNRYRSHSDNFLHRTERLTGLCRFARRPTPFRSESKSPILANPRRTASERPRTRRAHSRTAQRLSRRAPAN